MNSMVANRVLVLDGITPHTIPYDDLFALNKPVILKGLVKDWPLVQTARQSRQAVMDQLCEQDTGHPLLVYRGAPPINARFGYNKSCTGFNYTSEKARLADVVQEIAANIDQAQHDYLYINSLRFDQGLPGLSKANTLDFDHDEFINNQPVPKIWIGTESVAAAHFDQPKNIACCVLGKRRFTLFAPQQVENLYPGPLHPTPGGQVVTTANLAKPDFTQYPRLKTALENAYIADLEPGDGLYYPSMWWHEVEALDRFNIMVNFWWMTAKPYLGNAMDVLMHGMLSLRDKPTQEKAAWRALFDYYVFGDAKNVTAHLPQECHGPLAEINELSARRLRAMLLNNINR
ncbi:cupin-like domain-containing protein [Alteromonas gilva]|uniref:Cupin-like domain-containing protein n=1 Tax=Alteromonas gilva TaxID=2987522 RepID=A0ABT5L2Z4_9ALTE|nr:cupin-like domain-containing protein [Alteromonas gilva]MDC8831253.1 cupin-like domain-containing protein [Alteromonas gilva]